MVIKDHLSAMLNDIMNCKNRRKTETVAIPASKLMIEVLKIMKKNNYLHDFKIEKNKFTKVIIHIGKINKCGSIRPRFFVKKDEFDKYIMKYLPARDFGILIVSTSKGLMTHTDAIKKGLGGSLIAYCF